MNRAPERGMKRKPRSATRGKVSPRRPESNHAAPPFIVGLGASAGGLEALGSFFDAMPADSGMAFVVIQHLSPDHKSMMAELLSRNTQMPVAQAEDGAVAEPNHVYLIPPRKCLRIFDGKLQLTEWDQKEGPNLPVDLFFSSLSADCGERAIAIALSGTGSDGTRGIRAIKEAGGLVMIQDEESAKFSGMPHSAIATGLADYILPAGEMASALLRFTRHPLLARASTAPLRLAASTMQKIEAFVRAQTGIDFSAYKKSTVLRRLERRIGIAQVASAAQYLEYLQQTPAEVGAFAKDLLISVTKFFRDREAFAQLAKNVIPAISRGASGEKAVRVWIAGCATGEEAYSLGILLQEHAAIHAARCEIKIFATDVNSEAIAFAGAGVYPNSIAADVAPELLARYFVKTDAGYRVVQSLRDRIVFAVHNILRDPPFTRLELVSCRNLLIYLQSPAQKKILALFHFALRPHGYLFLGSSETVGEQHAAFEPFNGKARIFQKRGAPGFIAAGLASLDSRPAREPQSPGLSFPRTGERPHERLRAAISARLIADFAPTCFAVNDQNEILYSFGQPEAFIAFGAGQANLDLLRLAPPDLSLALAAGLHQAREKNEAVRLRGVKFQREQSTMVIDLKLEPMLAIPGIPGVTLVFLETRPSDPSSAPAEEFDGRKLSAERIADLEEDLRRTRESLQVAVEQRETSIEELQSANEELIASNEELHSSNEELESMNEELATLNSEFQQTNDELRIANDDLNNFLRTSQIGTIFLDDALRIRRFTPLVATEMKLLPHDLGRSLSDLSHPLVEEMGRQARRVLRDGAPVEKTVEANAGRWYLLRVTPYRREGSTDLGVVVTLVDVSALKKAQRDLRKSPAKKESSP